MTVQDSPGESLVAYTGRRIDQMKVSPFRDESGRRESRKEVTKHRGKRGVRHRHRHLLTISCLTSRLFQVVMLGRGVFLGALFPEIRCFDAKGGERKNTCLG